MLQKVKGYHVFMPDENQRKRSGLNFIISSVKQRYQVEPVTRRQHIIAVDNDATDETSAEFLPILNVNLEAEAKKGSAGLEKEDPNHIRKISDVTLSPQSQPADGLQQCIQSTTQTFPVPLPKLRKVRSTLILSHKT